MLYGWNFPHTGIESSDQDYLSSVFWNPYVSVCHLFAIIHTGDGDFALADEVVLVDVVHQATVRYNFYMEYFGGFYLVKIRIILTDFYMGG
jgi:hypothetical protein